MRRFSNIIIIVVVAVLTTLLMASCARMSSPDGGWYDERPPYVVSATPADRDTLVTSKRIVIRFNEFIKVDNPTEKVVISPPQHETPEIKATGKNIFVKLLDSLQTNTTYTIDFSDAISDNNEGNPMGAYTYSFSTGNHIDTLEVSGCVLDAETLEPIKGITVGLYREDMTPDSITPMTRVSRTDADGKFIIRGVAPGRYQIGAVEDMDNDFKFTQRGEKMAFSPLIVDPYCKPDIRQDTLWADQLHIKDITRIGYTHFFPDDIVLLAFQHQLIERHYLKYERKDAECFTLFFTAPHDSLPRIEPLDFQASDSTFVIEASEKRDTITYWLRDTALVNRDTLTIRLLTMQTDTLGKLQPSCDTLEILAKTPYAKRLKAKQEEEKNWKKDQEKKRKNEERARKYDKNLAANKPEDNDAPPTKDRDAKELEPADSLMPPTDSLMPPPMSADSLMPPPAPQRNDTIMPPPALKVSYSVATTMDPDGSVYIDFPRPLARFDTTAIHLYVEQDSMWYRSPFTVKQAAQKGLGSQRRYELYTDWIEGANYSLEIDSLAFEDIYGLVSDKYKSGIQVPKLETYGTLFMNLTGLPEATDSADIYVSLLSGQNVVKQVKCQGRTAEFYYIKPGKYYLSAFIDRNHNGTWDTGDYYQNRQPEEVYYYPEEVECKAKWDITKEWNVTARPLNTQKPAVLIKQKSSTKKTVKNRNLTRAREKGIELPEYLQ